MDVVLKAFNSVNRRFREGAEISAEDDVAPHDYADMKSRGFIGSEKQAELPQSLPSSDDH